MRIRGQGYQHFRSRIAEDDPETNVLSPASSGLVQRAYLRGTVSAQPRQFERDTSWANNHSAVPLVAEQLDAQRASPIDAFSADFDLTR
jgi:hypothetical protein